MCPSDKLERELCIDRARVFASGESMGGMMAWQLATDLAHRFAAVAPTVGAPHEGWAETPSGNCSPRPNTSLENGSFAMS